MTEKGSVEEVRAAHGVQAQTGVGQGDAQRRMTPTAQWGHYNRYLFLLAKLLFYGIIAAVTLWCINTLAAVIFPIFVSLLIAYLLDPGIDWLEARRVNRTVGILLYIFLGAIAAAGITLFLYPTIARLIVSLVAKVPALVDMVQQEQIPWLEQKFDVRLPPTLREALTEYSGQVRDAAPGVMKKVGGWISGMITQTGAIMSSLVNLIMIPVFSFYFLRDFDEMKRKSLVLLPEFRRDFLLARLRLMDAVVGEWFRGQLQVAGILGVLYSIGLTAVFASVGIEWTSGIAVGIVVGVLSIIPYFGVLIGIILTALIVLIEWSGIGAVIGVGVVFLVVQLLEGYVITPKIVGEKVGLGPVAVIIVLLLGGELGGLLGILLSIPVAGALKVLLPDLLAYYQSTPFYNGVGVRPAFAVNISLVKNSAGPDGLDDEIDGMPVVVREIEIVDEVEDEPLGAVDGARAAHSGTAAPISEAVEPLNTAQPADDVPADGVDAQVEPGARRRDVAKPEEPQPAKDSGGQPQAKDSGKQPPAKSEDGSEQDE